jgi:uncharacterized lipoprotein YmbA
MPLPIRLVPQLLAAALILGVAGCSSPNPALYTIAPVPGTAQPGGPRVVRVREVGLARYLDRPEIVRSSENYRLAVMANDWWGEPLRAMLTRVLVEELGQRLPGSTVYAEGGSVSVDPDATVELDVQRLDEDGDGNLVFAGQASVVFEGRRTPAATQSFRLSVPPPQPGIGGEVAAASTALGQVADRLAASLRRPPGV